MQTAIITEDDAHNDIDEQKPTIYLAGPISNAEDYGVTWREEIKRDFGDYFDFADPLDQYNSGAEDLEVVYTDQHIDDGERVSTSAIVDYDKHLIQSSHAVLVNWPGVQSDGTAMEVSFAHSMGLPVVIRSDVDLSIWMFHHSDAAFTTFREALTYIMGTINYRPSQSAERLIKEER